MPTSLRDGATAPPKQRKPPARPDDRAGPRPAPAPSPAARPDDRAGARPVPEGVKPALAGPFEPPHPVLQRLGFNGGITELNDRVQAAVDAHRHGLGSDPSPGIVWDVVRSPVPPDQYDRLFEIPGSHRIARLAGVREQNQDDAFVRRPDGLFEPENPLTRTIQALAGGGQTLNRGAVADSGIAATVPEAPEQDAHGRYPWVASGFLPIENFPHLVEAVRALSTPDMRAKVEHGGLSLDEFQKEAKLAGGPGQIGASNAQVAASQAAAAGFQHVTTVKDAQRALNKLMGTDLPETGFLNEDWARAISNWQGTRDYFRKTTKFLADQHELTVYDFVQAWSNQQKAVRENPYAAPLLSSLPLRTWVHPNSMWGSASDLGLYLKGRSNNPLNIALHGLTRSAGLTLGLIGGTVSSLKADAAAANAFNLELLKHPHDLDAARAHAHKVIRENPSWLRVLDPSLDEHPQGWLQAVDRISNVAIDLIVLRKPGLTGETVAYGDVPAAVRSSYLHASSNLAYDYLRKGKLGRASALMEGGAGAERLATVAEPLIRRGLLSRAQFKQHLAELYANGETTITFPGRTRPVTVKTPEPEPGSPLAHVDTPTLQARLDTLNKRYDDLVEKLSRQYDATTMKGITAARNVTRGKVARGKSTSAARRLLPTIREEARSLAETKLLNMLESHGHEPLVGRLRGEVDEARALQEELALRSDPILGEPVVHEPSVAREPVTLTVRGPVLDSLRTAKLTTPSYSGQGWQILQAKVRDVADSLDRLLPSNVVTDSAVGFAGKLRAEFGHAVATGKHSYFDPRLPERIHDWTLGTFKDAGLANKWESDFVRARAHEDLPRMQAVFDNMQALYHERFPIGATPEAAQQPFEALLGTEAPSVTRFPQGGSAEERYLERTRQAAASANRVLNTLGKFHAKLIVSGAPFLYVGGRSLFYKHMIADTMRRAAGGGFILGRGLGKTSKDWEAFLKANPEFERSYGAFLERAVKGETRWLLNRGQAVNRTSFQTSERFGDARYMEAAGGYLRRHLLDDAAMDGFLRSTSANRAPLVDAVLHDRELRGMWKSARRKQPDLSAEEYADLLYERYLTLREAGNAAGVDPFADGLAVLRKNRGPNVDKKLGAWIADSKLDFEVKGAQVTREAPWDELMNGAINHLMVFNKWNRGGMARNVFLHHWGEARKAGIADDTAARIAMSVAEKQTVYHMLDFANRLKIEQDLRWVSYFATKHRLYWKWMMGTFLRNPRYAAAVDDVRKDLDPRGNLNFEVFGHRLQVPVARLFWVPGKEYSETSPVAGAVAAAVGGVARGEGAAGALQDFLNASAGTNGNLFTRSDQGIELGIKWARVATGKMPATYGAATAHLPAKQAAYLNRGLNEFQLNYLAEHGHYAPESDAVKHVLWHAAADSLWRSNLPLPVLPAAADRTGQQKLLARYMAITDPAKRRKFFDDHPGFSDHFGIYDDPRVFLRNREYFAHYTDQLDAYRQARQALFARAKQDGFTPELMREKRKIDAAFQAGFDRMLVQDAKESGVDVPKGRVPNGETIPYGRWGKLVEADPLLNPQATVKAMFPELKPGQYGKVYGALQKDLQYELRLLGDPEYAGTFDSPDEVKARKREILQQLETFRSYPKDALGRLQATYILEHVNPYWRDYERRYQQIRKAPRTEQDMLKAQFYAWREAQDKPIVIDGIKFPPPARMAWATLDPHTRQERLSYLASANWDHLTGYEKQLLGTDSKNVDQGWLYMTEAKDAYRKEHPGEPVQSSQLVALAKQIEKVVPGFYRDYLTAQQPLIRRYEAMSLYREMPQTDRAKFTAYIGTPARQAATAIRSGDYNASQVRAGWVNYVDTQLAPWLNDPENASLRKRLELYGPDFLHSLVTK